jgi:hypothetical protein
MRTRFDQFAKDLLRDAFSPGGRVETDAEVSNDTQRIDVSFQPDPARASALAGLGLLGELARTACLFEPFHRTPGMRELRGCLRKQLAYAHTLELRAPAGTPYDPGPMMRVVSAGRPHGGIRELGFRPARGLPPGVYVAAPGLRLGLIVLSELPPGRDTLLLRLMGAGSTLKRAVRELMALPSGAPERALALPILVRLRLEIPEEPIQRTQDDVEFLMSTHDVVETWKQQWIERGIEQGEERGIERGKALGKELGKEESTRDAVVTVYEARFGAMPPALRAAVSAMQDQARLKSWLKLVSVSSADEIAAQLCRKS